MSETYRAKYGIDWDPNVSDIQIELNCAKKWREPVFKAGRLDHPADHLLRAIRTIFPPSDPKCPITISPWTEEHAVDWTTETFCITWGCASSSKAQPLDSTVYAPSGPRTMGELEVGDEVLTIGGKARVLKTHDVGIQKEYRVLFSGGVEVLCAGDHLWEVGTSANRHLSNRIIKTEEMVWAKPRYYFTPICKPLAFDARPVQMDPYVLGCLIGDGTMGGRGGKAGLVFTSVDQDIVDNIAGRLLPDYELSGSMPTYRIVKKSRERGRFRRNAYQERLREMGLWGKTAGDKFVPKEYLYNSIEVRRDILAGLLDTDGTAKKDSTILFSSASERLSRDVMFLVQSLGGHCSYSRRPNFYRGKDGTRIRGLDANVVQIVMADAPGLFKCARKSANSKADKKGTACRRIISVEPTGRSVPMKCITIDDPRGLYVVSGCVPTHNSNDYGMFVYLDWATDPTETYTILASTDKLSLQRRSYESVMRYFQILRARDEGWPGVRSRQKLAIVFEDDVNDGEMSSDKASITGVAVQEGTTDEARARLQGVHLPYVRIVADELSGMRRAIMEARFNLAVGPRDFRFFGLCNPDSLTDLAAEHSVPLKGWSTVDEDTPEWRSIYGKVRHHNGFFSPAVTEPDGAKKYPHIINQAHIDSLLQTSGGNPDHPQIWTMVKGFPPPRGLETTVLTERDVVTFGMQDKPVWDRILYRIAGLDPAFTSGGDGCIFVPAEVGILTSGQLAIAFMPEVEMAISASDPRPVTYQIVDQLRGLLGQYQIPIDQVGIDDSGTQSVADVAAMEIAAGSHRVVFNSKPSDQPLAPGGQQPADKKVGNAITELYYYLAALGAQGQIRGLTPEAMRQFCARRVLRKKSVWSLEEKKEVKQRIKRSPDVADACALALAVARFKLGIAPGASQTMPSGPALISNPVDVRRIMRINNLSSKYGRG